VTSNHLDYSASDIHEANYMSNIVPQVSGFNQGIWVKAENVAECYCDIAPITVYGGVVYDDTSDDYFQTSHGIRTPDFFWRTVVTTDPETGDEKAINWLIPNEADLGNLDDYIVSIDALEADFGARYVGITASAATKALRPETTWRQPSGCDLGLVADIQRP
jgi:endonuclease G